MPSPTKSIILSTINAKQVHASLGLRYLYANMGDLKDQTSLLEFDINQNHNHIIETLILQNASIIGFGIYIWNIELTKKVIRTLKKIRPEFTIIIGGPEVSHNTQDLDFIDEVDCIICGEADLCFAKVCQDYLSGKDVPKIVTPELPKLDDIRLPYSFYSDDDLRYRIVYAEFSRGCPFKCQFCLSSLDEKVRNFDTALLFNELNLLIERGNRGFKFVDRTFNLNLSFVEKVLEFFLNRLKPDTFLHFEMIPDRLPGKVIELLSRFPEGSVQLEVGIQSFTPEVGKLIERRLDEEKVIDNLQRLIQETQVHIHADLIIGLPGETWESLRSSFDKLWHLKPHEIQVGILKNLKGTPIDIHRKSWQLKFRDEAPYDILSHKNFDYLTLQKLKRMARYVEIFYNSGRFTKSLELLVDTHDSRAFDALWDFSGWIWSHSGKEHEFSLMSQYRMLIQYLSKFSAGRNEEILEIASEDFLNKRSNSTRSKKSCPKELLPYVNRMLSQKNPTIERTS